MSLNSWSKVTESMPPERTITASFAMIVEECELMKFLLISEHCQHALAHHVLMLAVAVVCKGVD